MKISFLMDLQSTVSRNNESTDEKTVTQNIQKDWRSKLLAGNTVGADTPFCLVQGDES
jgi:hypothetical protein